MKYSIITAIEVDTTPPKAKGTGKQKLRGHAN